MQRIAVAAGSTSGGLRGGVLSLRWDARRSGRRRQRAARPARRRGRLECCDPMPTRRRGSSRATRPTSPRDVHRALLRGPVCPSAARYLRGIAPPERPDEGRGPFPAEILTDPVAGLSAPEAPLVI